MESIIQDYLGLLHPGWVDACGWVCAIEWKLHPSLTSYLITVNCTLQEFISTRLGLNIPCWKFVYGIFLSVIDEALLAVTKWSLVSKEWRVKGPEERQNQFSCSTNWKVKKTILFTGRCGYRDFWPFAQGVHFSSSALSQVKSPDSKLVGDEGYLVDGVSCRIVTLSSRDQVGSDRTRKMTVLKDLHEKELACIWVINSLMRTFFSFSTVLS